MLLSPCAGKAAWALSGCLTTETADHCRVTCMWWLLGLAVKAPWLGPCGLILAPAAWTGLENATLTLLRSSFLAGKAAWALSGCFTTVLRMRRSFLSTILIISEYNRSGLLCGHCKEGYSLVLGTHQCRKCTSSHLALLIPFALMGVALVILLLIVKLTVATGTLSGLVFYANIVGVNHTIFLPMKFTDALSMLIAWLNLDFGIETCFYNGMDAYSRTCDHC